MSEEKKELVKVESEQSIVKITKEDVKRYLAPSATDQEIGLFLMIAKSYNLNPFKREIHLIPFKDADGRIKHQTVVGYESYIKRAEHTGQLGGWKVWIEKDKAFIEIKRKDFSEVFKWEVDKSEFDKGFSSWKKMPNFMLKKVAIAQGFRLAFSEELGGMPYIPEEISETQASENLKKEEIKKDGEIVEEVEIEKPEILISEPQRKRLYAIWKSKGYSDGVIKKWLKVHYGTEHTKEIQREWYEQICYDIEKGLIPQNEEDIREKTAEEY
ncbi:MAG: recombinase RecT [Patescibacteria group bacterium]